MVKKSHVFIQVDKSCVCRQTITYYSHLWIKMRIRYHRASILHRRRTPLQNHAVKAEYLRSKILDIQMVCGGSFQNTLKHMNTQWQRQKMKKMK